MKFNRGKSVSDPIYLRKEKSEYWMEGDVYGRACSCLDQIFGSKNYFVNSYTPKIKDFRTGAVFNQIAITDRDGDFHTFVVRVVDKEEFDRTQYGANFRSATVEPNQVLDQKTVGAPSLQEAISKVIDDTPEEEEVTNPEDVEIGDFEDVRDEVRQEIDKMRMESDLAKEGLTSEDEFDGLKKKHKKKATKKTKKAVD